MVKSRTKKGVRHEGLEAAVREDVQGQQVLAAAERAAATKKGMAMALKKRATLTNERVPFDWQLVKVDQTSYCDPAWLKEKGIATLGYFYLVDMSRHVHICSLTPSLELHALVPYATFEDEGEDGASDETRDEVDQELRQGEEPVSYFDVSHVRRLPRLVVKHPPEREVVDGQVEDVEAYYDRAVEEMREHYQGNDPWF